MKMVKEMVPPEPSHLKTFDPTRFLALLFLKPNAQNYFSGVTQERFYQKYFSVILRNFFKHKVRLEGSGGTIS